MDERTVDERKKLRTDGRDEQKDVRTGLAGWWVGSGRRSMGLITLYGLADGWTDERANEQLNEC